MLFNVTIIKITQIYGPNDFRKDLKRQILVTMQGWLYDIEIYAFEILIKKKN